MVPSSLDKGTGVDPSKVTIEIQAASDLPRGAYELAVVTAGGTSDKRKLHVDDIAQAVESEPNGDPQSQAVLTLPVSLWGTIGQAGDQDYFAFDVEAGQTIVLDLAAKSQGSKLNGVLTLFDPALRVVASNNDFDGDDDPLLAYRVPVAGRYRVRLTADYERLEFLRVLRSHPAERILDAGGLILPLVPVAPVVPDLPAEGGPAAAEASDG